MKPYHDIDSTCSLPTILHRFGYRPTSQRGRNLLYRSPFREETTPSFHVNVSENNWFDFGLEQGGDVVDFVRAYLGCFELEKAPRETFRCLEECSFARQQFNIRANGPTFDFAVTSVLRQITNKALIRYITDDRQIPRALVEKYLVQLEVYNRTTATTFHALGMRNVDGGFSFANPHITGCAGRPDISFFRGASFPAREVHVFETFMDMLSALADAEVEVFRGDMIVLHGVSNLALALPYIEHYESYERLYAWLDNDRSGEKATQYLQSIAEGQPHLTFCQMNTVYAPFHNVNACRVERMNWQPY